MSANWSRGIIYVMILVVGVFLVASLYSPPAKPDEVPLSQVISLSEEHNISSMKVDGQWLNVIEKKRHKRQELQGGYQPAPDQGA